MNEKKPKKLIIAILTGLVSGIFMFLWSAFLVNDTNASSTLDEEERQAINKINSYRAKNGLKKLKISMDLSEAAEAMAQDMADNPDSINHEHKDSKGRLPSERAGLYGYTDGVGENLAAGYETADKAYKAWKGSPEHNENMIDRDYVVMGIARVVTDDHYKWYWVNMFGDREHNSDLLNDTKWKTLQELKITVTDPNGNRVGKAKVVVFNENRKKIIQGKTNSKGKKTFKVDPRDMYYVRASATGYAYYTKRVKPGSDNSTTVRIWLEKE